MFVSSYDFIPLEHFDYDMIFDFTSLNCIYYIAYHIKLSYIDTHDLEHLIRSTVQMNQQ